MLFVALRTVLNSSASDNNSLSKSEALAIKAKDKTMIVFANIVSVCD